jgi:hypothetical protein
VKVCIKFEAAPKWFLSTGTNGYCGVNDCCEWYPKETEKVVFCSPKRPLLNWFPLGAGEKCDDTTDKAAAAKVGVEIVKGAVSSNVNKWLSESKVARWYIFRPKRSIWVNFRGSCNGRCWNILCAHPIFGLFYIHLIYFVVIWYTYFVGV